MIDSAADQDMVPSSILDPVIVLDVLQKPRCRPTVTIDPPLNGWSVLFDSASRRYYRVGRSEAAFLQSLDGKATTDEIVRRYADTFTESQVEALLSWLDVHNLICRVIPSKARTGWSVGSFVSFVRAPHSARFTLCNPDQFLTRHPRILRVLFNQPSYILYVAAMALPIVLSILAPSLAHRAFVSVHLIYGGSIAILYIMLLAMNIVHELAHAAVCKHNGGTVGQIGIMLMFFTPVMYCDVSSIWRFTDLRRKLMVTLAGIGAQLVVGGIVWTAWIITKVPVLYNFSIINLALVLMNLFPFIKLDGYWLLVHLLNEPNLARDGLRCFTRSLKQRLGLATTDAERPRAAVLAFGTVQSVVVPLFWFLGMIGLYRFVSRFSQIGAYATLLIMTVSIMLQVKRLLLRLSQPRPC
jgi:putative peptide zinc metalloprotease protein